MTKKVRQNILFIGLGLLLSLDIAYTFFQHYTKPLDGDLVTVVLYVDHFESLKNDPFGWQVISEGKSYGGVNRFFTHWCLSTYFKTTPFLLQKIVSPIESLFYASAFLKTSVHLLLLAVLSLMVSGAKQFFSRKILIAAVIIAPLLQTGGHFYKYFGVVDQSITYSSFYALPIMLLLWFLKPYYDRIKGSERQYGLFSKIALVALVIILPFSGPLIPGVVLVLSALICLAISGQYIQSGKSNLLAMFTLNLKLCFIIIVLLSVYSIFLGQYNIESAGNPIALSERYFRLPKGLFFQLTQKLAFPLLFVMIGVIIFFNKKYNACGQKMLPILKWIGLFALLYILLLPLGGFREYRPNIIRKDTFLPITIALIFFYAYASFLMLQNKEFKYRKVYLALLIIFSLIFSYADEADADQHLCQQKALQTLSETNEKVLRLDKSCNVLTWMPVLKAEDSENQAKLLKYWNITEEQVLFYQE